jgi:predicted nucleotidyltransferase
LLVASQQADRDVELFSEEFFTLLDDNSWLASNIARTGEVVLAVDGEMLRFRR